MCDKLRVPRRPPSIFGARRGEIQDDLDPVSISAPTWWCASVVPCSVTAAMLADFQIRSHLLHCPWIIKRDGQTVPVAVPRQRVIFFAHGGQIYRTYSDLRQIGPFASPWARCRALRSAYCGSYNPLLMPATTCFLLSGPKGQAGPHRLGDTAECGIGESSFIPA